VPQDHSICAFCSCIAAQGRKDCCAVDFLSRSSPHLISHFPSNIQASCHPGVICPRNYLIQITVNTNCISFLTPQIPPSSSPFGATTTTTSKQLLPFIWQSFCLPPYSRLPSISFPLSFSPRISFCCFLFCLVVSVSFSLSIFSLSFFASRIYRAKLVGTNTASHSFTFGLFWQYAVVCARNEDERNNLVNRLDLAAEKDHRRLPILFDTIFATTSKDRLPLSSVCASI